MLLPRGITGFFAPGGPPPAPQPVKPFQQLCHWMARENGGRFLSLDPSLAEKNFYAAHMEFRRVPIYLLLNAYAPYCAFAQSLEHNTVVFLEPPAAALPPSGYRLLSLKELNKDCREAAQALGEAELEQIRYWKPRTVGEVVFNFWD